MSTLNTRDTPVDGCLDGRTCLVIGGGSLAPGWAIGKAISVAYARAGANVVVADIDHDAARATVDAIEAEGGAALAASVDVTSSDSMGQVVAAAVERFGGLHVVHNNVGIGKSGDSSLTSPDDWRRISDANLLSLHVAAQAAIPEMKRGGGGVFLTTSSVASLRHVGVAHLAYGVTKAAANHFCRMLAVEYAPFRIRANSLVVGLVDTPRIRKTMMGAYGTDEQKMLDKRNAQVPLGFMGDAWDVANAAVFLASERARFISGAELVIDGAFTATTRG